MDTNIKSISSENKPTPMQNEGEDDFNINIKPFHLVNLKNFDISYQKLRSKKHKDFTLYDVFGKLKKFHKSVLEDSGKFKKLQKLIDEESEFKLWFEVSQEVLDSIESLVYQDEDESSLVKFEHIFELFKLSVALEDLEVQNSVISYLSLDSKTLLESFTTPVSKEFLVKASFDFLTFLQNGKDSNLIGDQQLYENALTLINDLFQKIFKTFFIEDNFDSLISIFKKLLIYKKDSNILVSNVEICLDLILKQNVFSINQKIKFLEFIINFNNYGNDKGLEKIKYIKTTIDNYILNNNSDLTLKDLNEYEKSLSTFDIKEDNRLTSFKNHIIVLQGYSKIVSLKNKVKELNLKNQNLESNVQSLSNEVEKYKLERIEKDKKIYEIKSKEELVELTRNFEDKINKQINDLNSTYLTTDEYSFLNEYMPKGYKNFRLNSPIYKATRDGFGGEDFHNKVKGIKDLLVIIT